jgi:hypothetical protein
MQKETEKEKPARPASLTQKLARDELAGEKIKDIADRAGYVIGIVALAFGILIWSRIDDLTGFLIGFLIMCVGIFAAYILVIVLYSYGDMVTSTIEQTKLLKKLETSRLSELKQEEVLLQAAGAVLAARTDSPSFGTISESAGETPAAPEAGVSAPDAGILEEPSPLHGVIDERTRSLGHFEKRSRHGIVCPLCGRLQDANRDKCYACSCRFVFDDEQPAGGDHDRTERH